MSPFEQLPVDERTAWLEMHTTRAFLATMREFREQMVQGLIESVKAGSMEDSQIGVMGGQLRALDQLWIILTRKAMPRG